MSPTASASQSPLNIHATTVAIDGCAAIIRGASGSGKSGLALQLMAMGAQLVSDDRTVLVREGDHIYAEAPNQRRGQIEARGVGILSVPVAGRTRVTFVVDMDEEEVERLPRPLVDQILGVPIPVIRKCRAAHFPAAILVYLQGERVD